MLFDNMFINLIQDLFSSKSNKLIINIMIEININVFFIQKYINNFSYILYMKKSYINENIYF